MTSVCPICFQTYAQLSQHLRIFHRVKNLKERKLLLALESGRVNFREGECSVPGCNKTTTRLDRHIKTHKELTKAAQRHAIKEFKRRVILQDLATLRASNPAVPMALHLDLVDLGGPMLVPEQEEECQNPCCQRHAKEVADLNEQVDTLRGALRNLSRKYRLLKRKTAPTPSAQVKVTKTVLSTLEVTTPEQEDAPLGKESYNSPRQSSSFQESPASRVWPSTSQATSSTSRTEDEEEFPQYPDHVPVLSKSLCLLLCCENLLPWLICFCLNLQCSQTTCWMSTGSTKRGPTQAQSSRTMWLQRCSVLKSSSAS